MGGSGSDSDSRSTEEEFARLEERQEKVLATLSSVVEPCTGKGVVGLGLIQDVLVDGETLFEGRRLVTASVTRYFGGTLFSTASFCARFNCQFSRSTACYCCGMVCSSQCIALGRSYTCVHAELLLDM